MSMRVESGEGDTAFHLVSQTLIPFGMAPQPEREGPLIGKDLPALRKRMKDAGFSSAVAWTTQATLPIHDVDTFMEFVTSGGTSKFLGTLEPERRKDAEAALRQAAAAALGQGPIQFVVAVVVAKC